MSINKAYDAGYNDAIEDKSDISRLKLYLQPTDFYASARTIAYRQGYLKSYFGIMYKAPYSMTQIEAIRQLDKKNLMRIGTEFLRQWYNGKTYYIDTRIKISANLRKLINQANSEAIKNVW